jgi:hypothetical protein
LYLVISLKLFCHHYFVNQVEMCYLETSIEQTNVLYMKHLFVVEYICIGLYSSYRDNKDLNNFKLP